MGELKTSLKCLRSIGYMKDVAYERPREKLQGYGVSTLSNAELIQVIVGSGTVRIPIGRLARSVAQLISSSEEPLSIERLCALPGVGIAKAAQVIAALELGSRINRTSNNVPSPDYQHILSDVAKARQPSIGFITLDGAGHCISVRVQKRRRSEHPSVVAKRVVRASISDQAAACVIAVNSSPLDAPPVMEDIRLAYECRIALSAASIRLIDFLTMTPVGAHSVTTSQLPRTTAA